MPSAGETSFEEIGLLLKQRCEDTKLYLKHDLTAIQLAARSGYRSYSTFSLAFKQRMGQSVTAWIPQQSSSQQADKQ